MNSYPIGTPGQKWGAAERAAWLAQQRVQRSYADDVLAQIPSLTALSAETYGELAYPPGTYPLVGLRSRRWEPGRPVVLITGGVHGYETSGVHGALRFAAEHAARYAERVNVAIAPCVSPWGYETINRWNPDAVDPNRSFYAGSPAGECAALMRWIDALGGEIRMHIDLHETTDTDNSEFRPAKAARDGETATMWDIPDGFYLVGHTEKPAPAFQQAIIASVRQVTHIAEADSEGRLIGVPLEQPGVVNYDAGTLGLCMGITAAPLTSTTEVYPDSPRTSPEACIRAQVAAAVGGLEHALA